MVCWDALAPPWQCCLEEAWTAYRAGSLPIGAVIVDAAGQIIARGRNRSQERAAPAGRLAGHPLAHAEMNALIALDYTRTDRRACVLYTTTEPCPLCVGAQRMSGLGEIRYASRDPAAGSATLFEATPYMRRRATRVVGPEHATLEIVIMALNVERGLTMEEGGTSWVTETWEQVVPEAVALGRALYATGELRDWAAAGDPIAAVVERLGERVAARAGG